jgi:YD repeat-containing protein
VHSALPGFADLTDITVAAKSGKELYIFNDRGKHKCTLEPIGNVIRFRFGYDEGGRLGCIVDCSANPSRCSSCDAFTCPSSPTDHSVTTIEHDGSGQPSAIIGPYGQETALTPDAHGYLASVENPAGDLTQFSFNSKGQLQSITDPNNSTTNFSYNGQGRLEESQHPPGYNNERGSDGLVRTQLADGYSVTHTNGEGVETNYTVEILATGEQVRTTTLPDGTLQVTRVGIDGSRSVRRLSNGPPLTPPAVLSTNRQLPWRMVAEQQAEMENREWPSPKRRREGVRLPLRIRDRAWRPCGKLGYDRFLWHVKAESPGMPAAHPNQPSLPPEVPQCVS